MSNPSNHFQAGDKVRATKSEFTNLFTPEQNVFIVESLSSDNQGNPMWLCRPVSILGKQLCHFFPDEIEKL